VRAYIASIKIRFFFRKLQRYINNYYQQYKETQNRSLHHPVTTTNTNRRGAVVLTSPSPKEGKTCRSRACCNRHTRIHQDKTPKDQRTRATTIANADNRQLEETDLKPHKRTRRLTGSQEIYQTARCTIGARIWCGGPYPDFRM
jgi:hypothetical protein